MKNTIKKLWSFTVTGTVVAIIAFILGSLLAWYYNELNFFWVGLVVAGSLLCFVIFRRRPDNSPCSSVNEPFLKAVEMWLEAINSVEDGNTIEALSSLENADEQFGKLGTVGNVWNFICQGLHAVISGDKDFANNLLGKAHSLAKVDLENGHILAGIMNLVEGICAHWQGNPKTAMTAIETAITFLDKVEPNETYGSLLLSKIQKLANDFQVKVLAE